MKLEKQTERAHLKSLQAGNLQHLLDPWHIRHLEALSKPSPPEGIVIILKGWAVYADCHRARFDSGIGMDYFLGPEWAKIGVQLRVLLNGDCGRLDCGTLDAFILDSLATEGFDENGEAKP